MKLYIRQVESKFKTLYTSAEISSFNKATKLLANKDKLILMALFNNMMIKLQHLIRTYSNAQLLMGEDEYKLFIRNNIRDLYFEISRSEIFHKYKSVFFNVNEINKYRYWDEENVQRIAEAIYVSKIRWETSKQEAVKYPRDPEEDPDETAKFYDDNYNQLVYGFLDTSVFLKLTFANILSGLDGPSKPIKFNPNDLKYFTISLMRFKTKLTIKEFAVIIIESEIFRKDHNKWIEIQKQINKMFTDKKDESFYYLNNQLNKYYTHKNKSKKVSYKTFIPKSKIDLTKALHEFKQILTHHFKWED